MDWRTQWGNFTGTLALLICVGAVVRAVREPNLVNIGLIVGAIAVVAVWTLWERFLDEPLT